MSGTDISVFQQASLDDRWRYAQAIAQGGDLVPPGLRNQDGSANPGKVLIVMEQATVLGFHPMIGVNNINVIDGKISLPPALMQAAIRNAGHKLRVKKTGTVEGGDFAVSVTLIRSDDDWEFEATWTPQRAARAGLCQYVRDNRTGIWSVVAESRYGKPLPWQMYTEAMCKARAISEVCMEGATDVLMGAVYTPEELGAMVDEGGVVIDHAPQEQATPTTPTTSPSARTPIEPAPNASQPIDAEVIEDETDWDGLIRDCLTSEEVRALWWSAQQSGSFEVMVDDITLKEAIERRGALLAQQEESHAAQQEVNGDETPAERPKNGAVSAATPSEVSQEGSEENKPSDDESRAEADAADAAWLAQG